jgi:tetratricopeptide (TPR) repeat protein
MATNPYRDNYRVVYSQTNLLLANSIAGKKDLTESDRSTVTQLIQQGIREAKNAVALNSTKVTNVENLATIYRNLLNLAQGADSWTIASYRQAIILDPVNPNLRVALGGVLYSLKNYDEAINFFRQAIDLKPNLANAHYNLAAAYREKGDFQNAYNSMQQVIQLVDKTSADYTKSSEELEQLRQKLGAAANATPTTNTQPATLTTPAPLPSPIVSPKIKLPESFSPEAPATPSAQP